MPDDLGMCAWHPGVPYDTGMVLCGDDGMVRPGQLVGGWHVPYRCTGGAHRAGLHIRCTSPAHAPEELVTYCGVRVSISAAAQLDRDAQYYGSAYVLVEDGIGRRLPPEGVRVLHADHERARDDEIVHAYRLGTDDPRAALDACTERRDCPADLHLRSCPRHV